MCVDDESIDDDPELWWALLVFSAGDILERETKSGDEIQGKLSMSDAWVQMGTQLVVRPSPPDRWR
jgi:hypothetical protein